MLGIFVLSGNSGKIVEKGRRVKYSKAVEKLLTIDQLSELIQVSRKTLYQWTHIGFIPYYKLPKGVRFKASEVEKWLRIRRRRGKYTYKITL